MTIANLRLTRERLLRRIDQPVDPAGTQRRRQQFVPIAHDDGVRLVDRLAETYARYLVPVTKLIHDKTPSIQKFADAFKFRKDK